MQPLFDTALNQQRQARMREHFLLEAMAEMATGRLDDIQRRFEHAVIVCPHPTRFVSHPKCSSVTVCNMNDETLPFAEGSLDAVVLLGLLHRVNDVPGVLAQAARSLKPDGLFLALFLGGETLSELRDVMMQAELDLSGGANARIHPTIDVRDSGALLQRAGFALPVVDATPLSASYESATHLMRDLRAMGETNVLFKRSRTPLSRKLLERVNALYKERYSDEDGRVLARFDVITMTGWKPHTSQQQPSARGSGVLSLKLLE